MKTDTYTKITLIIIAICLFILGTGNAVIISEACAENGNSGKYLMVLVHL